MDVPVTWPRLLETARLHGGQLHILPGEHPHVRESGQWRPLLTPKLNSDDIIALFWSMADEESKHLLKRTGQV
jgi:Tfp pilus assembly pilus retraction ATPase PilT